MRTASTGSTDPATHAIPHHFYTYILYTLFLFCSFAAGICAIFQHHIVRTFLKKLKYLYTISLLLLPLLLLNFKLFSSFIYSFFVHFWVIWFYKLYLTTIFRAFSHSVHNQHLSFIHSFIHRLCWLITHNWAVSFVFVRHFVHIREHFDATGCKNHIWFAKMMAMQKKSDPLNILEWLCAYTVTEGK